MASEPASNASSAHNGLSMRDAVNLTRAVTSSPPKNRYARSQSADGRAVEANSHHVNQSRLEELLEQQNLLMSRHIALVEENHRRVVSPHCFPTTPKEILARVDPAMKHILHQWRNDFREKVRTYVAHSCTCSKYDKDSSNGELMRPFAGEARRSWQWLPFYRAVAKPIDGIDPVFSDGMAAGMIASSQTESHSQEEPNAYSIDAAFAELRHRHAQEVQRFVIAHQKACLDEVTKELTLKHQLLMLAERLSSWKSEQSDFHTAQASELKQQMEQEATKFVEMVFWDEMSKAEVNIRASNNVTLRPPFIFAIRAVCVIVLLLSITHLDGERLTQLFAVLFALCSGMALLWEDVVLGHFKHLLGGAPWIQVLFSAISWRQNVRFAIQ